MFRLNSWFAVTIGVASSMFVLSAVAQSDVIPHGQSQAPGPALSPQEAVAKMTVPEGFSVEVVASEPDIMNPVAMTFDDQGRIWVTESFEYPRRSAGPGRDRIKVLEDTDSDGKVDKVTVFAEGLNIPSGIAVGYGGVWVANSPDILFLQDTDGDGKADKQEVVVTGFGRTDTHELPNAFTWGPDGWLYGLNGVFNYSHVKYRGKEYQFTCAMFRIHPVTREFELFAEGTSNPWGIAIDGHGNAFVSACVIDHLWHIAESGYYHRQGGPYPPHTWKLNSIVKHKHQKAAYCGITYFDSSAYPESYREKLYMGNIHGGCINCDYLNRDGATYFAKPDPDFLTANDAWFMPVAQKTGPDGCLYILDWYDRYHCYQDANRDPEGIDRGKGRLYRVRYQQTPRAQPFNLAIESDSQLVKRLFDNNIFYREQAQRLLAERRSDAIVQLLERTVLDDQLPKKGRMHALWALVSTGKMSDACCLQLLQHSDSDFRAWAVRFVGNVSQAKPNSVAKTIQDAVSLRTADAHPDVRLQVAIAANKISPDSSVETLLQVLGASSDDPITPSIVWQNLLPSIDEQHQAIVNRLDLNQAAQSERTVEFVLRLQNRLLDDDATASSARLLLNRILEPSGADKRQTLVERSVAELRRQLLDGSLAESVRQELASGVDFGRISVGNSPHLKFQLQLITALLGDQKSQSSLEQVALTNGDLSIQFDALNALTKVDAAKAFSVVQQLLKSSDELSEPAWVALIDGASRLPQEDLGQLFVERLDSIPDEMKFRVVEMLTQRSAWAASLLTSIRNGKQAKELLHVNQIRRLQAQAELADSIQQIWGTIRNERNPHAEENIAKVKELWSRGKGDPVQGHSVYMKTCGQCHKLFGEGEDVGPEITSNGRGSFDQLLSNVLDPNLVIGPAYQARTIVTNDGRSLTGLVVEESDLRVRIKLQGGKIETIDRKDV
ncbi:MAG: dehydrogenase, partial [Planctomycetales bacterium]|nr:dehydrogenase [Planctomycetales bacterium]